MEALEMPGFASDEDKGFVMTGFARNAVLRLADEIITGIPRLLDIGQCNDAHSAIQIALALAKALNCSVNELPLFMVLS